MTTRAKRSATSSGIEALVAGDRDVMKSLMQEALQEFLEAEMSEALGAASGERTGNRLGHRPGSYGRGLVTRIGKLEPRVPRDREGRFSTEWFAWYQRSEKVSRRPGSFCWPTTARRRLLRVETEHFSDAMATIGRERTRYLHPRTGGGTLAAMTISVRVVTDGRRGFPQRPEGRCACQRLTANGAPRQRSRSHRERS